MIIGGKMNDICKSIRVIEDGIEDIIGRYLYLRDKINNDSAYTREEVETRLKYIQEADVLNRVLRMLDIQDFELKEYNNVKLQ
jgi:hypothetical protein